MLVLGLDTALRSCSVAIMNGSDVLAEQYARVEKGHAEHLAPMALAVLRQADVKVGDLDRVGVVIGPGAFAGVRVGLAFARGLALGTKLDVVGISSLAALAGGLSKKEDILIAPVIDARRGQVYAALFDADLSVRVPPFVASPADATMRLASEAGDIRVRATGDGAGLLASQLLNFVSDDAVGDIDAKVVAQLAAGTASPEAPPSPLYLRAPDAKRAERSPFAGLLGSEDSA